MKSLIKQIETRFELFESVDLKQAANDPKAFVVDMYNQGKSKAEIVDALLDAGHHRDHAEELATRWQDSDGDGNWYEPGDDVQEASTSAGAGAYMTPKAFGKADDDTIEALGYRKVQEAMDKKYAQLIEGYRSYVTENPKLTPEKKVKNTTKRSCRE